MVDERKCPADPLEFISECVRNQRVYWTYHVNMRLKDRFLPREMILESADYYEIIEAYPEDKYLPSYLVYARHHDVVFHILFAADVEERNVRVITSYYPDPVLWDPALKTRRKS